MIGWELAASLCTRLGEASVKAEGLLDRGAGTSSENGRITTGGLATLPSIHDSHSLSPIFDPRPIVVSPHR